MDDHSYPSSIVIKLLVYVLVDGRGSLEKEKEGMIESEKKKKSPQNKKITLLMCQTQIIHDCVSNLSGAIPHSP